MGTLKERLAIDEELFCFDGKTQMERVKVISVDKAAKTAVLSNRVVCSRYPDVEGNFLKQGAHSTDYTIKRWDEATENYFQAFKARQRVRVYIGELQVGIMNRTSDLSKASPEDIDKLIKADKYLTKVFGGTKK